MLRGPRSDKGADLYSPQTSTKSAQNDGQTTHVNKQTYDPKVKAQKGTTLLPTIRPSYGMIKTSKD